MMVIAQVDRIVIALDSKKNKYALGILWLIHCILYSLSRYYMVWYVI